jgi:dTDP-4-amino-4,6-dideoxygalactose transaminase
MSAVAERTLPFVDLTAQTDSLRSALAGAMDGVLQRGDFVLGADVDRFEREFADYCGVPYAVGTDSGLSALELALRASGIGPGSEVITQANTFIATVAAIRAVGARPVLVDCDSTGAIAPEAVAAAITPRTKAIIPVHLFGRICDIEAIDAVAQWAGAIVIEDACQAHGAVWRGRRAGSFGISAAFSFYPAKNLGAFGDGGILVTQSRDVWERSRTLRNYGQRAKYDHVDMPLNRRLDTLQAAVLRVKLPLLDGWNTRRQFLADTYRERLAGLPIGLPPGQEDSRHVYHLFVITTSDRDKLRAELSARGIETGIHYPVPVHLVPVLRDLGYRPGAFRNAEQLAATSLSLPMYPELPLENLERVATAIRSYFSITASLT